MIKNLVIYKVNKIIMNELKHGYYENAGLYKRCGTIFYLSI